METRWLLREEVEDLEKDGDKDSASRCQTQTKTLEDAAKDMDRQIRSAQGSQASMFFRRMEDIMLWIAQNLMGAYNTLRVGQEVALAQAEWKQSQYKKLLRQVQTRSASATQADQAGKEIDGAITRAKAARDEMERMKKGLLILTGYSEGSQTKIGPMPVPRLECVCEMGGSVDKWWTLRNNYLLKEQRSGGVSPNKESHVRRRDIRQSEEVVYGQPDTLYQDVLVGQTFRTSVSTSMESQETVSQAASNELTLGMLSRQEYLETKAVYMNAATAKERVDAGSQQVMDTHDQAPKGFMT